MKNEKKFEIERKYLLKTIPENLESYEYTEIAQGYISTTPVIRIRKKIIHPTDNSGISESYVLTIKSSGMLQRQEYEMDITADEYKNLAEKAEGNIIAKTRYMIPIGNLVMELDIFEDAFHGLVMGEIEFPDKKTADSFEPADFFPDDYLTEVTFDKRFHNSRMSTMSSSEIHNFLKSLN